jgi:putative transposase
MTQSYPSDLTDDQWSLLEALLPSAKPGGRPRTVDLRAVVNAILYILCTGCPWRYLCAQGLPQRQDGLPRLCSVA